MPRTFLSMLVLVASCATVERHDANDVTIVYVVRHAEKARVQGNDPALTPAGHARVQALVRVLGGVDIDGIYATQYRRTVQTVKPLADARSTEVHIVTAGDTQGIVDRATRDHRGKRILVAGHYNTVPDIIRALGVRERVTLGHDDHGDLFVVTIAADGTATLDRRRFDP